MHVIKARGGVKVFLQLFLPSSLMQLRGLVCSQAILPGTHLTEGSWVGPKAGLDHF